MTTSGQGSESAAGPPAEAGPGATVPENEQELRQEIEQTRERLGDTVELLVAKTDIKGRAQAKVAGLAGWVKGKSAPEGFRRIATKGADAAREYRVSLAAALLAVGSGYLAFRLWPKD
jgi:Protein of unknown function (DUF3618)